MFVKENNQGELCKIFFAKSERTQNYLHSVSIQGAFTEGFASFYYSHFGKNVRSAL